MPGISASSFSPPSTPRCLAKHHSCLLVRCRAGVDKELELAMQADTTDSKSRMRVKMTVFQGRQSDAPCNKHVVCCRWDVFDSFNVWRTYGVGNPMPPMDNATFAQVRLLACRGVCVLQALAGLHMPCLQPRPSGVLAGLSPYALCMQSSSMRLSSIPNPFATAAVPPPPEILQLAKDFHPVAACYFYRMR